MRQPPRRGRHHPPRGGSADFAEEYSVPEGRPKSGQAPIRRPPCARRATAPECAQRFSLWTVHGPFLFWQDKREMGGASRWTSPPGGSQSPRGRRPAAHIPGRQIAAPTVFTGGTRKPGQADTQVRPYGVYRVRIFPNPCNESPAKRTYLTERRENPHGRYGTDLPDPCQDRL